MILLVRHAHARESAVHREADGPRPLSPLGWQQAAGITRRLAGFDLDAVVSSPALRCVQSVDDLAHERQLPLRLDSQLLPGARPDAALRVAEEKTVLCTHGEVIGGVLDLLRSRGTAIPRDAEYPPGSVWLIDYASGPAVEAVYLPPLCAPARTMR